VYCEKVLYKIKSTLHSNLFFLTDSVSFQNDPKPANLYRNYPTTVVAS